MKFTRNILIICGILLLFACGGKSTVKTTEDFDAEKFFTRANKLIDDKEYNEARRLLLEIRNRDLSKKYAPLAQLRIADSHAREEEPDLAVAEYRKFLEMYPDHMHASYAQYQIAMVYFGQIESPDRGYGGAALALAEFEKLKRDFPRNPYKDVIEIRIEKCRNTIASYELFVGEFYMKKGSYQAAQDRFLKLLKDFPDFKGSDVVLMNLGITYKKDGQKDKSEEYLKRLIETYPSSPLVPAAKKELTSLNEGKK